MFFNLVGAQIFIIVCKNESIASSYGLARGASRDSDVI